MHIDHFRLRDDSARLNGIGLGVQWIPAYVHTNRFRRHSHDVVEMAYIVDGQATHYLGNQVVESGPGSLGIVHYTQSHEIVTTQQPVAIINLYLDIEGHGLPSVGPDLQRALNHILPMHPSLRHRHNQFVHLQFPPGGEIETVLRSMLREQERAEPGYRECMLDGLRHLMILSARIVHSRQGAGTAEGSGPGEGEHAMEGVRRTIDAEPTARLHVGALARRLGVSTNHLCRSFKRHTGVSLLAYALRQRLNAAMVALRSDERSVLDIAIACGFSDQSFFNRKFKAALGVTPTAYRHGAQAGRPRS